MLSEVEAGGQEQSARANDAVPIWECVEGDIEVETRSGFVVPTFTRERKSGPATLRRRLWIVPLLNLSGFGPPSQCDKRTNVGRARCGRDMPSRCTMAANWPVPALASECQEAVDQECSHR